MSFASYYILGIAPFVTPFMPNVSPKRLPADRVAMEMHGPVRAVASARHEAFSLLKRRSVSTF